VQGNTRSGSVEDNFSSAQINVLKTTWKTRSRSVEDTIIIGTNERNTRSHSVRDTIITSTNTCVYR